MKTSFISTSQSQDIAHNRNVSHSIARFYNCKKIQEFVWNFNTKFSLNDSEISEQVSCFVFYNYIVFLSSFWPKYITMTM